MDAAILRTVHFGPVAELLEPLLRLWDNQTSSLIDSGHSVETGKHKLHLKHCNDIIDMGNTLLDMAPDDYGKNFTVEEEFVFRACLGYVAEATLEWMDKVEPTTSLHKGLVCYHNDLVAFTNRLTTNFSADQDDFDDYIALRESEEKDGQEESTTSHEDLRGELKRDGLI